MSLPSPAQLILASASPRRLDLLRSIGIEPEVLSPRIDESERPGEGARELVLRLAREKGEVAAKSYKDRFVIAADTAVVVSHDRRVKLSSLESSSRSSYEILGKPGSVEEAVSMLGAIEGRTHLVVTGVWIGCAERAADRSFCVETSVTMFPLSEELIKAYVASGEPMDKAGAYAAQGIGAGFIKSIVGSYTNVVGLPLGEVLRQLTELKLWYPELLNLQKRI